MDIAATLQRRGSNRCDPPREALVAVEASDPAVASAVVVVAAVAAELDVVVAAAAAELAVASVVVVVVAAAAAVVVAAERWLDSIVYRRQVGLRLEAQAVPRGTVRARERPTKAGDRFLPRQEDHRPAVDCRTRRSPAVAVVAVAAGTVPRPGEIPARGPIAPGVSPCCPCIIRRARQYLESDKSNEPLSMRAREK